MKPWTGHTPSGKESRTRQVLSGSHAGSVAVIGRSTLTNVAGSLVVPGEIIHTGSIELPGPTTSVLIEIYPVDRGLASPFLDLGMAVRKSKATGAIMVGCRHVLPVIYPRWIIDKIPVVDRVGMFIQKEPGLGRLRYLNLFHKLPVLLECPARTSGSER